MSSAQTFFDISNNNFSITCGSQSVPSFSALGLICQYDSVFVLPNISDNGITGTWSPLLNTATIGTTNYTFSPAVYECATPATLSLTINPTQTPVFNFPTSYCQLEQATLPSVDQNGITGVWNPQFNTLNPGTSSYIFTPDAGQCSNALSQSITINPMPSNGITQAGITLSAIEMGANYQWLDCQTNQPINGATNQSFTTTAIAGTYAVIVSLNACSDTSECISIDQSGIIEQANGLGVFPNPVSDELEVNWIGTWVNSIEILDASGKVVQTLSVPFNATACSISLKSLAAGMYHLRASGDNHSGVVKIRKM